MPKDEFDFDDPMELNGVAFPTDQDTSPLMAECFVEEFMRMGWDYKGIYGLFQNPHYIGMNMVMEKQGNEWVQNLIGDMFARRGKVVDWGFVPHPAEESCRCGKNGEGSCHERVMEDGETGNSDKKLFDPMGNEIPLGLGGES